MNIEKLAKEAKRISIDTRAIRKDQVFIAIKGDKFDGHDFVNDAFRRGAKLAVVSRMPDVKSVFRKRVVKVDDTLQALGDIAKAHRAKFDMPVLAVTGSNGKTTAKDMISWVLSSRLNVLKNKKSFNNFIGLPLSLLEVDKRHDVAVLEMGMNRPGEIRRLCDIAKPEIGVITNIGPSHLEFLKSERNVFRAKAELLKALPRNGTAILNKDDKYLRDVKWLKAKKLYLGIERKCDFQAKKIFYHKNAWHFSVNGFGGFKLQILGRHNIYNALVAIAVARQLGIDFGEIRKRINAYAHASPMRLEIKKIGKISMLDDSYNSNPKSMECALESVSTYEAKGKKIIVSGDMLELGRASKIMHELIGRKIARAPVSALITIGKLSRFISKAAKEKGMKNAYHAPSQKEAALMLLKIAEPGDVILIKGSRGTRMENIIESFKKLSKER